MRVTLSAEAHSRAEARGPHLEDIPPEWLEDEPSETEREDTLEDEAGAQAVLSPELAPFLVQVDPARPELLWVPGYASREEIASRLFGDASAVGAFDIEPRAPPSSAVEDHHICVRVRRPSVLVPELLATMRRALDVQLEADAVWSRAQLSAASLNRAGAAALVERGLRWAQRSDILDGAGQSYFDRYLQALEPLRGESQRGHILGEQGAQAINEQQAALAHQLQHLLEQLADAAKAPRGKPFLVITDKLSGPTKEKLAEFLRRNVRGTQIIEVEEAQILGQTKQLRAALKLPEDLPGGAP
ncbi:hypothetical protein F0U62_12045 [Cystobacter fuscus]|uniref:hypothetical protein n=1 Tax=Cystobacter fuscus TaxID=43 RepID=UPI002B2EB311|nr:hypothetical protein F0U62_12045 [Cystobacter fuscus]